MDEDRAHVATTHCDHNGEGSRNHSTQWHLGVTESLKQPAYGSPMCILQLASINRLEMELNTRFLVMPLGVICLFIKWYLSNSYKYNTINITLWPLWRFYHAAARLFHFKVPSNFVPNSVFPVFYCPQKIRWHKYNHLGPPRARWSQWVPARILAIPLAVRQGTRMDSFKDSTPKWSSRWRTLRDNKVCFKEIQ